MITLLTTPENGHGRDSEPPAAVDELLYLTGRPTLKQFLRFVSSEAVNAEAEGSLVVKWHAARDVVTSLEESESGLADGPCIVELGPEYDPLLMEFLKDPIQRENFNTVPTEIALVELDSLVVYQKHIDLAYAARLECELGAAPSRERIFRACLPYDHPRPPVKWSRVNSGTYVFVSPSSDLRFLGAVPLTDDQLTGCPALGDVVSCIGLAVGFGSNFMNAIYAENRLILNNGSHRAFALRKMGFTHAPCIVQHVPSRDALEVVACEEIRSDPDLYLKHRRPPMLRDYFDSRLHTVFPFRRRLQQITVRFETAEANVPAF